MLRIAAIVLLFANLLGSNLRRITYPQLVIKFSEQALKPTRVPSGLHSHPHPDPLFLQFAVELLGLSTFVCQPPFSALSSLRIHPRDLLYAWVIVTTYNQHLRPPFCRALVVRHVQVYSALKGGRRLYEINIARLIPSRFPRPHVRSAIPLVIADDQDCYRIAAVQTGTRLRLRCRQPLQPASFYARRFQLVYKA